MEFPYMPSPPCKAEDLDMHSRIKELSDVCTAWKDTTHIDCGSSVFQLAIAKLCHYNGTGSHGKLAHALASHLRPAALAEFDKAMAAVFVAGAEVSTLPVCPCPALLPLTLPVTAFISVFLPVAWQAMDVFSLAAEGTACSELVVCRWPMHTVCALCIKRCRTLHLAKRPSV